MFKSIGDMTCRRRAQAIGRTVTVGRSGCQFTSIQAAINSVGEPADADPVTLLIYPDVYNEQITLNNNVHLMGMGQTLEGPACVHVTSIDWVIKTKERCNVSNMRFTLLVSSTGTKRLIDGQGTVALARTVFHNCYFIVDGTYGGGAAVKFLDNRNPPTIVMHDCLVYFRPLTTGAITFVHESGGPVDAINLVAGHYMGNTDGGFSSCIFWQKDYAAAPAELNQVVISREYPTSGPNVVLFKITCAQHIILGTFGGSHLVTYGALRVYTSSGLVLGFQNFGNDGAAPADITSDDASTGITLLRTPKLGTKIIVMVNGIEYPVSDGDRSKACFFSRDEGASGLALSDVRQGDALCWNTSIAEVFLETDDVVSILYDV